MILVWILEYAELIEEVAGSIQADIATHDHLNQMQARRKTTHSTDNSG